MEKEKPKETAAKLEKLEHVLYKRATEREVTTDVKTYRVLNLSANDQLLLDSQLEQSPELARRFAQEGVMLKQEITIKQHLPDATVGKWMHEHLKNKHRKEKFDKEKSEGK